MSMFRLLRGEMHKILMRPILYIITGVLVLALFLSVSLINMSDRSTYSFSVVGDTKDAVYENFLTSNVKNKTDADELVKNALNILYTYKN